MTNAVSGQTADAARRLPLKSLVLSIGTILAGMTAGAGTVYVDCNLSDYAGHDGSSWEKACKTIQEGVDKADPDDTVLVQPGRYDEGGAALSEDSYLTNRVYISKRITVKSRYGRDSRDTTFIVGRHATGSSNGMGLDAIRCVRFAFDEATHGAVLEGFTLIDGATHYNKGSYGLCSIGGGACFGSRTTTDATASYLVDCVISNCVATRGAAMYFGNAVRCRITRNSATSNGAGVRDSNLYWSILDHNFGSSGVVYLGGTRCVNCTIVNHPQTEVLRGNTIDSTRTHGTVFNTVILHNSDAKSSSYLALTNCVFNQDCAYYWQSPALATGACVRVNNTSYQFVSTATDDYRPLASGQLVGAADAKHLLLIPEPYRYTDFFGMTVTNAGAIAAGAVQEAVTPQGGVIKYSGFAFRNSKTPGIRINGGELSMDLVYDHAVTYPRVHRLEFLPASGVSGEFYGFQYGDNSVSTYAFPNRVTSDIALMAPPSGSVMTVSPHVTDKVLWTDPTVSDSAEMDGSAAKPFNTLQAAVDKAAEDPGFYIVHAKKGHYNRGGAFCNGHNSRVAINVSGLYMRFVAEDGPDETFIEGAADPDSTHSLGYGDNAYRCFASLTGAAQLSGFTLAGGRVRLNSSGTEDPGEAGLYGGAISGREALQVEDCVITNCAASRGAVAWGAALKRCRITDCVSSKLGAIRNSTHASACVFENIRTISADVEDWIIGLDEKTYNCTFVSTSAEPMRLIGNNANSSLFNAIVCNFADLKDYGKARYGGSYYDGIANVDSGVTAYEGLRQTAIGFADAAHGDYAPYSASKAVGGATVPPDDTDFWRFGSVDDIEGRSFGYEAGGPVNAGAYSRTSAAMAVDTGTAEGVSPQGVTFLTPGQSVTLTATKAATRNFQGFYSDGVLLSAETTLTIAYDAAQEGVYRTVETRYVPYWYVDPKGSDANGGRSWTDAKKTLSEVMKLAIAGDTVYAAPGVYDEGSAHQGRLGSAAPSNIWARVVVPEGVSLVSRDGAACTTIKGASATVYADQYGSGSNALRCAFLYPHAQLTGFTLTDGRGSRDTAFCDDSRGAGVHGSGSTGSSAWWDEMPIVKDCVITNCVTRRGAGAALVKAVNCRFVDNRATGLCAATQHCQLHNCYIDGNHGDYAVGYSCGMFNCTFGARHDGTRVVGPSALNGYTQRPTVCNSLFLCSRIDTDTSVVECGAALTNCVFNAEVLNTWPKYAITNDTCLFVSADQLAVDAEGVPVIGANAAVDRGVTNYLDLALCGDTDCAGRARRVNGERMDVGAYEADWLPVYAKDLGGRRLTTVSASPAVCENELHGPVLLPSGEISFRLDASSGCGEPRLNVRLQVTGNGTLTLRIGETAVRTYTAADGAVDEMRTVPAGLTDLHFAYEPGPNDTGWAELRRLRLNSGMLLFLR